VPHRAWDPGIVYYYVNSSDYTDQSIQNAFRACRGFYVFGFVIEGNIERRNDRGVVVTTKELDLYAAKIRNILVSAYDGEGYLIWTPQ
jgi:hypothetical protein